MKKSFFIVLVFFFCLCGFTQAMDKRYFEKSQEVGGDVLIKSSSVKVENGEICKIFEIECPEAGAYYMDAWIVTPFTPEGICVVHVTIGNETISKTINI